MDELQISQGPIRNITVIEMGDPSGYQQLTVTSAVGLTAPSGTNRAIVQAETGDIRYRDDGTNPTTSVGMYLVAGNYVELQSEGVIKGFKMIAVTGSVTVNVSFYRK